MLTAVCYWPSSHCVPPQKFVSVSGEINHGCLPLVLNSDKGVCCHHFSSVFISVAKLRPAGRIRHADQFNPTRQIPCTFFSSATFPTVDSSATALTAACHVTVLPTGIYTVYTTFFKFGTFLKCLAYKFLIWYKRCRRRGETAHSKLLFW